MHTVLFLTFSLIRILKVFSHVIKILRKRDLCFSIWHIFIECQTLGLHQRPKLKPHVLRGCRSPGGWFYQWTVVTRLWPPTQHQCRPPIYAHLWLIYVLWIESPFKLSWKEALPQEPSIGLIFKGFLYSTGIDSIVLHYLVVVFPP